MKATLHTDGGARGNPGPAGIGYVLKIAEKETIARGEYIGETTNNQAEYQALLKGLQLASEKKVTEIACYLDSELVVKQLRGEYRVKHVPLKPLHEAIQKLGREFNHIAFHHIPRAKNSAADKLVNEAIDRK